MKNITVIFLISCSFIVDAQEIKIIEGEFIKRNRLFLCLDLPYDVEDDVKFVFDENTPFAIDIIQILVDGMKLFTSNRGIPYYPVEYFRVHEVTEGQKKYFISMFWLKMGEDRLIWDDARGPTKANHSLAYEIWKGMRILDITYRIILPYPSLTIENLSDKDYKDKKFTKIYRMRVNVSSVFENSL